MEKRHCKKEREGGRGNRTAAYRRVALQLGQKLVVGIVQGPLVHVAYIDAFVLLTVVHHAVLRAGGALQLVEDLRKRETEMGGRERVSC